MLSGVAVERMDDDIAIERRLDQRAVTRAEYAPERHDEVGRADEVRKRLRAMVGEHAGELLRVLRLGHNRFCQQRARPMQFGRKGGAELTDQLGGSSRQSISLQLNAEDKQR